MPSPFPGMDPYLEGYLWPDVHNALAYKIRQQLVPRLRPRYTARLNLYVVEDTAPEGDIGILYPDAEGKVTAQIPYVEIHDAANNQLVTCIELLSPVNKREPGLTPYRQKRQRLYQAGIHLVEIDLLRRGTRSVIHPRLPAAQYLIALTRAHTGKTDVWPLTIHDPLPTIPIPLRSPDEDVLLDLSATLRTVYDEAAYELSLKYDQDPPPPALSDAEMHWLRKQITEWRRQT